MIINKYGSLLGLLCLFAGLPGMLSAQTDQPEPFAPSSHYRTWTVGIKGGVLSQANIFELGRQFEGLEYNMGYGAFIRKQILPALALQLDYVGGSVSGSQELDRFETQLPWSVALSGHFVLGNVNWRHREGFFKPYLNVGAGMMVYKPWLYEDEEAVEFLKTQGMFIPLGLGGKFRITNGIHLDLGYRMNFARSYGFDGVMGEKRDIFSFSHVGLEFALGPKSKPFLGNSNPVAQLYDAQRMQYDDLLAAFTSQSELFQQRESALKEENEKLKSQIERIYYDLADDDKDGVANRYDKCPDTPEGVRVDGAGCPLSNSSTTIIQQIRLNEEDRRVVDEAINNLEFDLGKSTIKQSSFTSLNRVAVLLIEKNFSLKLAGHTDNTGPMDLNLRLSKARAEAVKKYLVSKGVNASRIEATGYGPSQPVANNATEEGRQKNRRVEFTLY